ncbi:MAG: hypothetical protein ACMUHM_00035 [Thermoplasmatota archaeon]
MTYEEKKTPVCSVCGRQMCQGVVAVRLNRYCIKHIDGWYCPEHAPVKVSA